MPPVSELRRVEDGKLVCELERADVTALLATGWKPPERFVAKGRDGKTDIYGVIFRPFELRPVEEVSGDRADLRRSARVLRARRRSRRINGRRRWRSWGSSSCRSTGWARTGRSKAFHDVCWKNLADAGFPDRILWMKAAAEKYPAMDLTRVGIYGGSAGGQNALGGLLFHGDFYKAAAADCGCHDNRMDKIWWNELWMGWPVGPHYAEQSNVTNAHRLTGKLLLTVGELDRERRPLLDDAGGQRAHQGRQGFRADRLPRHRAWRRGECLWSSPDVGLLRPEPARRRAASGGLRGEPQSAIKGRATARPLPKVLKSLKVQTTFLSRVTSMSCGLSGPAWQLPKMRLPLGRSSRVVTQARRMPGSSSWPTLQTTLPAGVDLDDAVAVAGGDQGVAVGQAEGAEDLGAVALGAVAGRARAGRRGRGRSSRRPCPSASYSRTTPSPSWQTR